MANTSSSSSINFALINQVINRYVPIPLLFFGIIGNILNILVFSRKIFHNNICVTYFLASSIFDSLAIGLGFLLRPISGFGIDPSQNSSVFCKIKFFIIYFCGSMSGWFISLACFERYLSSSKSVYKRELITMKRAYLSIPFVILLGFLAYGEIFYCIDINQQLLGAPQSCYQLQKNIQCQLADSLIQFLFEILTPTLMMIIFGLLTLQNVHQKRRRITAVQSTHMSTLPVEMTMEHHPFTHQHPIDLNNQPLSLGAKRAARKRDAQLITMLLVQVIVFVISAFPIGIYKLYSIGTIYDTKSILRKSIENTTFNLCVICLYLDNCVKFYIHTLCGAIFRKELMKLFRLA